MAQMWLSGGTAILPNRLWQFDVFRPSTSARWWKGVNKHHTAKRLTRRLDALGYVVMLRSKATA